MLMLVAMAAPMSAWAQYAPFQPPGGLAPATTVGASTLAQMLTNIAAAQSGLSDEIARAKGAEATLQGNITTEAQARANADANQCALAGCLMSGSIIAPNISAGSNGAAGASLFLNGAKNGFRQFRYQTGGVDRWIMSANADPESGSNAGSNWGLSAFADDGGYLYNALTFNRSTGVGVFYATPQFPTAAAGDNSTNAATMAGVRREIATGYTVATLPTDARRYAGARAYVTDATACTFLGSPTGGGSTFCPVIYSGAAWIAE
ncbi:hypothetical protein ACMAUO_06210 [Gluconacetobacter sp. Hr-1-5]|uniref:hypothetical protein n=1 Tax=Gluconacetobacter sp. Hr-1-5 TaxID=3395370 RepID=UPI003B530250